MTDNATDFGQEAYGQFYLPLTNKLRERGIDAINPQQHGFSGRWRVFHTGYEGIVYMFGLGRGWPGFGRVAVQRQGTP